MVEEWSRERMAQEKHRGVESAEGGVARRAHNPKVAGSSPAPATTLIEE
jgi:hypothetical protein